MLTETITLPIPVRRIILQVQGIPLSAENSYERIQERLSRLHSGAEVTIAVLREGRLLELKTRLP